MKPFDRRSAILSFALCIIQYELSVAQEYRPGRAFIFIESSIDFVGLASSQVLVRDNLDDLIWVDWHPNRNVLERLEGDELKIANGTIYMNHNLQRFASLTLRRLSVEECMARLSNLDQCRSWVAISRCLWKVSELTELQNTAERDSKLTDFEYYPNWRMATHNQISVKMKIFVNKEPRSEGVSTFNRIDNCESGSLSYDEIVKKMLKHAHFDSPTKETIDSNITNFTAEGEILFLSEIGNVKLSEIAFEKTGSPVYPWGFAENSIDKLALTLVEQKKEPYLKDAFFLKNPFQQMKLYADDLIPAK